MINNLLNRKRKNFGPIKLKTSKGTSIDDPKKVSQHFNEYFTSIAKNLKAEIDQRNVSANNKDHSKYLPPVTTSSIFINSVTSYEVQETIKNLKNNNDNNNK